MSIEIGNLVRSSNGKNKRFYGFVSGKEDITDRWNRTQTYYTAAPLIYLDGSFPEKPKPFKSPYANLVMSDLVRLKCFFTLKEIENELINEELRNQDSFSRVINLRKELDETRIRYDQIFTQLNSYIDPRGI